MLRVRLVTHSELLNNWPQKSYEHSIHSLLSPSPSLWLKKTKKSTSREVKRKELKWLFMLRCRNTAHKKANWRSRDVCREQTHLFHLLHKKISVERIGRECRWITALWMEMRAEGTRPFKTRGHSVCVVDIPSPWLRPFQLPLSAR